MSNSTPTLRIGQIDYLNAWPFFYLLEQETGLSHRCLRGHPTELNQALFLGQLDVAPASSFEYFEHGLSYDLLPGLSIAANGPVQSVLLISPVEEFDLQNYFAQNDPQMFLSSASATSVALLRVLLHFYWQIPNPRFNSLLPGTGLNQDHPFLEIGDEALKLLISPQRGRHIIDLASVWKKWTGLPFVFAVWMVRRELTKDQRRMIVLLAEKLASYKKIIHKQALNLAGEKDGADWISRQQIAEYWQGMTYDFGPKEQAGYMLFGSLCQKLNLLPSVPGLSWFPAEHRG